MMKTEAYERYQLDVKPAPSEQQHAEFSVKRSDDCIHCGRCVKACVYDVHKRDEDPRFIADPVEELCKGCFRCVQECPIGALTVYYNPAHLALGDKNWTPTKITNIWFEAETGHIPVSGAGYRGAFAGSGFDSLWTDMSEIVRPTRDGVHGREYISTSIDLGRKPLHLNFDAEGKLVTSVPRILEIPIPLLFDTYQIRNKTRRFLNIVSKAAQTIKTFTFIGTRDCSAELKPYAEYIIPVVKDEYDLKDALDIGHRIVEVEYRSDTRSLFKELKDKAGDRLTSARISLLQPFETLVYNALQDEADIIHLCAGEAGVVAIDGGMAHLKDALLRLHKSIVNMSVREGVTLIASGGIDIAEHMPKAIICGADAVAIDTSILVALGCCINDHNPTSQNCPALKDDLAEDWGVQRLVNLTWSWRDQMMEILGAMGMREARRLRGETGRAMVYDDVEGEFRQTAFHGR